MRPRERQREQLATALRSRLIERRRAEAARGAGPSEALELEVRALVDREAALLGDADRDAVVAGILRDTVGLGPLEDLLADPAVEEVMVNGAETVFVERGGRIEPADTRFADEEQLRNAIERILAPLGRRVDELSPMVDARLADGSRVNVVIPPLAVDGPVLSIRRFGDPAPRPAAAGRVGDADRGTAGDARERRRRSAGASSSAAAPARARRLCSTRSRVSSGRPSGW